MEKVQKLTDQLETGITELFNSERYAAYLSTMAKFHRYSFGNILLILLQCPGASQVAGYGDWKKNFGRQVSGASMASPSSPPALIAGKKKWRKLPRTVLPANQSSGCSA